MRSRPSSSIDAVRRILEPGDHHQRRGLAGAARAEEGDELAARNVDGDIVDGIALAVVRFDDVAQAKVARHPCFCLVTINASTTTQPRPSGSALIGLRSISAMAVGIVPGEIRQRVKARRQRLDVRGGLAAHRAEEFCALRLGDHGFGVALAQRQHPQGEVAHDLDGDAAEAERDRQAEIRIARDAGEHLDAVADELLHQVCGVGRARIELGHALGQCREGAGQVLVGLEADGDEAEFGLVRNFIGDALEHDRIAELARRLGGVGERRDAVLARHRNAVGGKQALGVVLVDRAPAGLGSERFRETGLRFRRAFADGLQRLGVFAHAVERAEALARAADDDEAFLAHGVDLLAVHDAEPAAHQVVGLFARARGRRRASSRSRARVRDGRAAARWRYRCSRRRNRCWGSRRPPTSRAAD